MIIKDLNKPTTYDCGKKDGRVIVRCDDCGDQREAFKSWARRPKNYKHLCHKCAVKYTKNEHCKGRVPANAKVHCIVDCEQCGTRCKTTKTKKQLLTRPRSFCGNACLMQWRHENTTKSRGVGHSSYKDGSTKTDRAERYGYGFTKKIKREIKIRDGYNCQLCNENLSGEMSYMLDVHHIDLNKLNNDPSNLICYCKKCHTTLHWDISRAQKE